ncbi:ABC transporter substrate-binding protein [Millisia brevis]|uniref:ABC transporter substrate-binding protein n=1 Tax=Millisia brevis TaxID=264148 RepID=UPI000832C829|nr:ABC transporter substrate-binding protein [Millisia brevis]
MRLPTVGRPIHAALVGVLGAAMALAGCASDSAGSDASTTASAAADGAFPATIDTAYGEVTVDEKPERIVVFTDSYLDLLDILGERPTAWADGYGGEAAFLEWNPWLAGTYDEPGDPNLLTAEYAPSAEAVAALDPDLILTDVWNVDEPLYQQLSQIAPTYVGIDTDTQTSWQDNLNALALLTGHDPSIVADTEAKLDDTFAAAADRLPGLRDKTFQVPVFNGTPPQLYLSEYGNEAIARLGLVPGNGQPTDGDGGLEVAPISLENIEQLDADVVFVAAAGSLGDDVIDESFAALRADPRLADLPAERNGALLYLTSAQWLAVNGGTPASYTWWLDQVVPQLEQSALNRSGA